MSLGFQHALFKTVRGEVLGVGRNNKYQLGSGKALDEENRQVVNQFSGANPIELPQAVRQVSAGKFHSVFLGADDSLYSVGYNQYGQLGVSNSLYMHREKPMEVYTGGLRDIRKVVSGWHHNLLLDGEGRVYHFGAKLSGQFDGK